MTRARDVADTQDNTGGAVAPFLAGKNKIINGDFNINQRAFTTSTSYGYGFDRFINGVGGGTGTATFSTQTFTTGSAPVAGYEGRNYWRCVTTGQSASGTFSLLQQPIEDVRTLAGQTVTISFWARANTGTPKMFVELEQYFGSGGSTEFQTGSQITISTSWTRYSVTLSVPSISGKTIGTGSALSVLLWVSAGSTYNARTNSLGIQSNTFDIWGVQVEAGNVATPFTTATGTIQGELAACQRYYYRHENVAGAYIAAGMNYSATQVNGYLQFPVTMRGNPTLVSTTGTDNYGFARNGGIDTFNSLTILSPTTTGTSIYNNSEVSGTAGQGGLLFINNANVVLAFNAEF